MFLRSHAKQQADDTATATFMTIPEEVIRHSLLPRLKLRDVLSLRGTCHWTKKVSDGYLQTHPLSKETVDIFLTLPDSENVSLASFLRASTIPKPVSRFRLKFSSYSKALSNPHLPEFLQRYGPQVMNLYVPVLNVPMELHQEFEFFSALPKLKNLTVQQWRLDSRESYSSHKELRFPQTFKNLTMIRLEFAQDRLRSAAPNILGMYTELYYFWRLVKFCTKLECLHLPVVVQYEPLLMELQKILNLGHHKNFQALDLTNCSLKREFVVNRKQNEHHLLAEISDFSLDRKIKLLNVQAHYLADFSEVNLRRMANQVVSLINLNHEFSVNGIPLPNVKEIKNLVWAVWPIEFQRLTDSLTRTLFPGLRKLTIAINRKALRYTLDVLWREFCNLEELSLIKRDIPNLEQDGLPNHPDDDMIFFGSGKSQPTFLQLTELKVLRMEVGPNKMRFLTDDVFSRVLRHMSLRELHLKSERPVTSFTVSGIQALLTGRFRETIQDFPFRGWSLAGLSQEQFGRLSKEFSTPKS